MTRGALAAFVWSEPARLWALALPLALWVWLAWRPERPSARLSGALALWRELALRRSSAGPRARRARPPLERALRIAALAAIVLALAEPRWRAGESAPWTFVVDRSPSMYLPADPQTELGPTRLERALERARERLGEPSEPAAWVAPGSARGAGSAARAELSAQCPEAWLAAPPIEAPAPDWPSWDRPRTVWITDALPEPAPLEASYSAGGGGFVPGYVATWRERGAWRALRWDSAGLVREDLAAAFDGVWIDPRAPRAWAELARAWARERGLELAPERGAARVLALEVEPAMGAASEVPERGLLRIGPSAGPPPAQHEAWALAGARTLDLAARGPLAVVPAAERAGAGAGGAALGERELGDAGRERALAGWCGLLALALWLGARALAR